jgi:RNA polymerase sigma-70 factor (ECF subfamily)
MKGMTNESIRTRPSLLERLKDLGDNASWDEFYQTYRKLIYSVARRSGLSEDESEEVVQNTVISVARKMPGFTYDPARDSFKGWLLTVTRWRMRDQLQRRRDIGKQNRRAASDLADESGTQTGTIERIPDPTGSPLEAIWDEEWEKNLVQVALARIKRQVHPRHYEIYYLQVILGQPVPEVARALRVSRAQIYVAKHRVGNLIRKEVTKLRDATL